MAELAEIGALDLRDCAHLALTVSLSYSRPASSALPVVALSMCDSMTMYEHDRQPSRVCTDLFNDSSDSVSNFHHTTASASPTSWSSRLHARMRCGFVQ